MFPYNSHSKQKVTLNMKKHEEKKPNSKSNLTKLTVQTKKKIYEEIYSW